MINEKTITCDCAVMTFKIINQLCPEGIRNEFIERSAFSKYVTWNKKDLHVQKLRSEYTKKKFLDNGPKLGIVSHSSSEALNP